MDGPTEITISVPWGSISGKTWGNPNGIKVFAVHGLQDNCGTFDRLIPLLRGTYYIMAIDLPGHGYSSPFTSGLPLNLLNYIVALKKVVDYYKWDSFYYLGHSLGGLCGTFFTSLFPDVVEKMILIDPFAPWYFDTDDTLDVMRILLKDFFEMDHKLCSAKRPVYKYQDALEKLMNRDSNLCKDAAENILKRSLIPLQDGYTFIMDQRLKLMSYPVLTFDLVKSMISSITCPCIVIMSTQKWNTYKLKFKQLFDVYEEKENFTMHIVEGKSWGNEVAEKCILMVHGIQDNCGSFDRLIPNLKGNYHIVAIDLPSHGLSTHFPAGLPIEFTNFVLSIKRVVNFLNWETFVYIGHSFGGQIGTYFTGIFPSNVEKLIILDTMGPEQLNLSKTLEYFQAMLNNQLALENKLKTGKVPVYSYNKALDKLMTNRPSQLTREAAEILIRRSIKEVEGGFVFNWDQRLKQVSKPTLTFEQQVKIISNICCPTLYIIATQNMARYSTYLKEIYEFNNVKTNTSIVVVEGNHDVHQNSPEKVNFLIDSFIDKNMNV